MKKIISIVLALALVLSLAGCGQTPPEPAPTPEVQLTPAPTPAPTPQPTPEPTPEPTPTPVFEEVKIIESQDESLVSLKMGKDALYALISGMEGSVLSIYDTGSGLTRRIELGDDWLAGMEVLADGNLLVQCIPPEGCFLLLLDPQGNELGRQTVSGWQDWYFLATDPQRGSVWYQDDAGVIHGTDAYTGEQMTLDRQDWLSTVQDGKFVLSGENGSYLYDMDTGEVITPDAGSGFLIYSEKGAYISESGRLNHPELSPDAWYLDYDTPGSFLRIEGAGSIQYTGPEGTVFCAQVNEDGAVIRAIDPDAEMLLGQVALPGRQGGYPYLLTDNGSALAFETWGEDGRHHYIWRYGMCESEAWPVELINSETLPGLVEELSLRLSEENGVAIHALPGDTPPVNDGYDFLTDFDLFTAYRSLLRL